MDRGLEIKRRLRTSVRKSARPGLNVCNIPLGTSTGYRAFKRQVQRKFGHKELAGVVVLMTNTGLGHAQHQEKKSRLVLDSGPMTPGRGKPDEGLSSST